jgi:hypothetical protein
MKVVLSISSMSRFKPFLRGFLLNFIDLRTKAYPYEIGEQQSPFSKSLSRITPKCGFANWRT